MVVGHTLQDKRWRYNIRALPASIIANLTPEDTVDIVGCTSKPEILPPGIKWSHGPESMVCSDKQLSKVIHVLATWPQHYDWYIKTRPEVLVREPIDLRSLMPGAINARVREYFGPLKVKWGTQFGGNRVCHNCLKSFKAQEEETRVVMDDQIYFFDDEVRRSGVFDPVECGEYQNEWTHTDIWRKRGAKFNIIGIHAQLETRGTLSGDLVGL